MNDFNLDLSSYSVDELHSLFDCKNPSSLSLIKKSATELKRNLTRDSSITQDRKFQVMAFLDNAYERLEGYYVSNIVVDVMPETINAAALRAVPFDLKRSSDRLVSLPIESGSSELEMRETVIKKPYDQHQNPENRPINAMEARWREGTFNQIHKDTINTTLNIDSKFRKNYYRTPASDFHMTLNEPIKNVISMNLQAMEIPSQIYSITATKGNNSFYITDPSNNWRLVQIPSGRYTLHGIANIVSTYIALATSSVDVIATTTPSLSLNPNEAIQGHIIFRSISSSTFKLRFDLADNGIDRPIVFNLGWILGFRMSDYEGNSEYVSEAIYDENPQKYMYLSVNVFNNNYNETVVGNFPDSKLSKDILARIQINPSTSSYSVLYNVATLAKSNRRVFFGPVNIEKIHIQLLDDYGQIVDLNNMDYSFAIDFESIYS